MKLGLLALLTCAAFAQTSQTARIEGRVVSPTGEPIPGVSLTLRFLMSQATKNGSPSVVARIVSDKDGRFQIDKIKPAQGFRLMASHEGFLGSAYGANPKNPTSPFGLAFDLVAGQVLRGVVIMMTPQSTITGRVTDDGGDPVAGAKVVLLRRGFDLGVRQAIPHRNVEANEFGEFRFFAVDPGRYYLAVDNVENPEDGRRVTSVTTFYPSAASWTGAATVDVTAGANVQGADIRLLIEKVYSIRGILTDLTGKPVAGAAMLAIPGTGPVSELADRALNARSADTQKDGSFQITGLPPGAYWLRPVTPHFGGVNVAIKDGDIFDIRVTSGPGGTVPGRWTLESGDIRSVSPQPRVEFHAESSSPLQRTSDDGTFVAERFRLVPHTMEFRRLPSGLYVKSARMGGQDALRSPIDIMGNAQTSPLEILLALNAASVTGTVTNEKGDPLEDVIVSLWTANPLAGLTTGGVETTQSSADGTFRFENLAPGVYFAGAWETISGAIYNRWFLADFVTRTARIELLEGSNAAVNVRPIPAAAIQAAEEKLP